MNSMKSMKFVGVAALFIVAALWQPFAARALQDPGVLATRLPLVMVSGQVRQLPAGDVLSAPDGASLGATTFTNGFSSLSGQAILGANGLQVNTFSGAASSPKIRSFNGDPNGVVTSDLGSLVLDTLTPGLWFNTDGASAWSAFSTSSAITGLNYGWFGNGIDGSPTFDGVTTILGMIPVANTYTLTRDLFLDSPICQSGVTFKTTGYAITVKTDFIGPASGTCTVQDDGAAAVNNVAGAGRLNGAAEGGPGRFRGGKNGGAGGCNNAFGGAGNASNGAGGNGPSIGYVTGNGGAGGAPNAGAGATSAAQPAVNGSIGSVTYALAGNGGNSSPPTGTNWAGGSGGGGGGSNGLGLGCGGGGGGGGGYEFLIARHVTNPSHVLVSANGGNGGNASGQSGGNSSGGGGGGGGGYSIVLLGFGTPPSQQANAGTFGAGAGGAGGPGVAGTNGQTILFKAGS